MDEVLKSAGKPLIRIFYDGGCKVCAWEVAKYLAIDTHARIGTIDINHPEFKAERFGLNATQVRRYFHVLTSDNQVVAGVAAFILIWEILDTPWTRRAVKITRFFPVRAALEFGYAIFIWLRPHLPRNAPVECRDGSCEL